MQIELHDMPRGWLATQPILRKRIEQLAEGDKQALILLFHWSTKIRRFEDIFSWCEKEKLRGRRLADFVKNECGDLIFQGAAVILGRIEKDKKKRTLLVSDLLSQQRKP